MNKRDYVKQALRHEKTDKVPYCIELTGEASEAYGDQLMQDYYNAEVQEDYKNGRITRDQAIALSIGNYMISVPTAWWGWDYDHMPESYKDPDEAPAEMPPIVRSGDQETFTRQAQYIQEKYGVYIGCLIYGSHWEKAYFTRGIENFLADIAGFPEFAQELLDFIIAHNMEMLQDTVKCPYYDGILLGSDWGTQNDLIMSPNAWRTMIKKGEKVQYDLIHSAGKDVMVHSCGCILRVMEDLVELGVDILNPVQPECMDLKFLKDNYGKYLTFWGGISTQGVLPFGTPAEVEAEAQRVIDLMSENGGYITCSSQGIQPDVPYENLKALIDTARKNG